VVVDYLERAELMGHLEALGFYLVGFGCTTCIGNTGPLLPGVSETVKEHDLSVVSVLSGNRNFEGRIQQDVKMNYLASPPLVVAYAIAGTMSLDLTTEPLGQDRDGNDVFLADLWPSDQEVADTIRNSIDSDMFASRYATAFEGDHHWKAVPAATTEVYEWDDASTYIKNPSYLKGLPETPAPVADLSGARVLARLGNSVTTDHISPAGNISPTSPAAAYLTDRGEERANFNQYGARRGNFEVMTRGTFANVRLRNQLAPGTEGGFTTYFETGEVTTIFDASMRYQAAGVPLLIFAGAEYGSGSSRDWAAKGTALLGVKAVVAQSYERIHRSNLIGMGVLPLQYQPGETMESLGLDGTEVYSVTGLEVMNDGVTPSTVTVTATKADGTTVSFNPRLRIDTPMELAYYRHGGILQYVLRQLAGKA
jgi:aconitate hydratase